MRNLCYPLLVSTLYLLFIQIGVAEAQSTAGWQSIKTNSLKEWSDPGKWWTVKNGVVVAESKGGKTLPKVHYLVWKGSLKGDFELSLQYRIQARKPQDAGVNFRVERPFKINAKPNLPGYQAELDTANLYSKKNFIRQGKLFGNIHDGKRGRMFKRGLQVTIKADGSEKTKPLRNRFDPVTVFRKPPEWNHCRIHVKGDVVKLYLNDVLANEIIDGDSKSKSTGDAIALQFRPNQAFRFEVKDLKYKLLK